MSSRFGVAVAIVFLVVIGVAAAVLIFRPAAPPPVSEATLTPLPSATPSPSPTPLDVCDPRATQTPLPTDAPPVCTYIVMREYPHDAAAFTQGLQFVDGVLYEGTGLDGASSLRRVALETGEVLQQIDLDFEYFGEGVTVFDGRVYQLTWDTNVGFVYDVATFEQLQTFSSPTEGWGLTHDGQRLIMSDGTATLYTLDTATLAQAPLVTVADATGPIALLNELEYINGYVYANVWHTDRIAKIETASGRVVAWLDLAGLRPAGTLASPQAVLNGIAYDAAKNRLFVTGKLWPTLFEIELRSIH
ncbi:MAG: glutaminyl-peptide cyclotransferase [Anaerolineales bacterium]